MLISLSMSRIVLSWKREEKKRKWTIINYMNQRISPQQIFRKSTTETQELTNMTVSQLMWYPEISLIHTDTVLLITHGVTFRFILTRKEDPHLIILNGRTVLSISLAFHQRIGVAYICFEVKQLNNRNKINHIATILQ